MKTIRMGLNTEPAFIKADEIIERWKGATEGARNIEYWEREKAKSLELRDEIIKTLEEDGECALSWSCSGRTRHMIHSHQWQEAMPEYEFEIGDNYECVVRKRG